MKRPWQIRYVLLGLLLSCLVFGPAKAQDSPSDKAAEAETEVVDESGSADEGSADEGSAENEPSAAASTEPVTVPGTLASSAAAAPRKVGRQDLIASLTIFVLSVFVGFEVITKVPPTLHTPLMSGSNAISGITLVGALIVASATIGWFSPFLGFIAVTLATVNVVGGFLVTHRMLAMFKKK